MVRADMKSDGRSSETKMPVHLMNVNSNKRSLLLPKKSDRRNIKKKADQESQYMVYGPLKKPCKVLFKEAMHALRPLRARILVGFQGPGRELLLNPPILRCEGVLEAVPVAGEGSP